MSLCVLSVWVLKCIEILSRKITKNNKTTKQWQTFNVIKSWKEKKDIGKTLGYAYTCGYLDP
jgi:hypothetical protein